MMKPAGSRLLRGAMIAFMAALFVSAAWAENELPYLGRWSNGRGETLAIKAKTLRFAEDKAVAYRDVTRATDGTRFELQITTAGKVNAFPGKIVGVECSEDSMEMTTYSSHAAYMEEAEPESKVTWFRDDEVGEGPGSPGKAGSTASRSSHRRRSTEVSRSSGSGLTTKIPVPGLLRRS